MRLCLRRYHRAIPVALCLGADATHVGAGVAVADYSNDGWPDIYVVGVTGSTITSQHKVMLIGQ